MRLHSDLVEAGRVDSVFRMIQTGCMFALMRFCAFTVGVFADDDVAMASCLVADRDAKHFRPPRHAINNLQFGGQSTIPSTHPIRLRGASSGQGQQNNE